MEFPQGLTQAEVLARRADGRGNQVSGGSGRTYGEIARANLFSYFNIILFSVGGILAVLGQLNDAFITAVVGFVNALIGTVQEIRAKQQLDQIAVVARPTVTVVRDGSEQEIAAVDLVEDDIIWLQTGDQAVVDGRLISGGPLEMDESLLTGETDLIRKGNGDEIFSGSFCVTGDGFFEAEKVGKESFANQLTEAARTFDPVQTPLQKSVNYIVQLLLVLAVIMGLVFYVAGFIQDLSFLENVKATAVLIGLVPYGLFLTIAVAYALGSVTIAKKGALVQQSNAVESLNSVDVLCMDKTGTLTSGRMRLDGIEPLAHAGANGYTDGKTAFGPAAPNPGGGFTDQASRVSIAVPDNLLRGNASRSRPKPPPRLEAGGLNFRACELYSHSRQSELGGVKQDAIAAALGTFVRSASAANATSAAILAGTDGRSIEPADEVPFSSTRKWSALAFEPESEEPQVDGSTLGGVYVLGAVEMLEPFLAPDAGVSTSAIAASAAALSDAGLRVLLFAHSRETTTLHDGDGEPALPPLTPLALVSLSDELRPQAKETLSAFVNLGVELKIISGDNPQTVAALAKQAGFENPRLISGPELATMNESAVIQAAQEATIFGRITPEQKQALVDALISQGHYVAMMGDGVNDVLSLKKANLGIAMQSGSNATRNVADMVLLGDSYAALVPALSEGKRIVNGITDATYLLVGRALTYALIIIGVMMVGLSFPFEPSQLGLTTFSVGLPALMLTLWARPDERDEPLLPSMVRFVLPFAIWTMLLGVAIYSFYHFRISESIINMDIPPRPLQRFERMTGLTAGVDAEFSEVAATLIAQTTLSTFVSIATMLLVLFLHPPLPFFTGWRPLSSDRRPAIMTIVLVIVFMVALSLRPVTDYFGIVTTPTQMYFTFAGMLLVWTLGFRLILRQRWVDKLLFPGQ